MLYKDVVHIVEYVGQGCKTVLERSIHSLYAPASDRPLEAMAELADRIFCFYDMQGQGYSQGRSISEEMASQTTSALMRWPIAPEAQGTKARLKPQAPGAGDGHNDLYS